MSKRPQDTKKDPKKVKKEAILDLEKHKNKLVIIKFQGNRQVKGILMGFDTLQNLVIDQTFEIDDELKEKRELGLVVCRGPAILFIAPYEGSEVIENPF